MGLGGRGFSPGKWGTDCRNTDGYLFGPPMSFKEIVLGVLGAGRIWEKMGGRGGCWQVLEGGGLCTPVWQAQGSAKPPGCGFLVIQGDRTPRTVIQSCQKLRCPPSRPRSFSAPRPAGHRGVPEASARADQC